MTFAKNPRFEVEVAENGYILQVHTPDDKKTPGSSQTLVFRHLRDLFIEITLWDDKWARKDEKELDTD